MVINKQTEEVKYCLICNTTNDIISDKVFSSALGLIEPYDIKKCKQCGLRWLSPRPTKESYNSLYSYDNYFEGNNAVESYSILSAGRAYYFLSRIKSIELFFKKNKISILDIGSATGEFVHQAISRCHDALGLELSSGARDYAYKNYKIKLLDCEIRDISNTRKFDVIHMNHVFEHLPDPVGLLKKISEILNPGGLFVLEVPQQIHNDLDRLKKILGLKKKPKFNNYSLHHTFFYTPNTMTLLLNKHGFKILSLSTYNRAHTPISISKPENILLKIFLWISDKLHRGGNIIEVYAKINR